MLTGRPVTVNTGKPLSTHEIEQYRQKGGFTTTASALAFMWTMAYLKGSAYKCHCGKPCWKILKDCGGNVTGYPCRECWDNRPRLLIDEESLNRALAKFKEKECQSTIQV